MCCHHSCILLTGSQWWNCPWAKFISTGSLKGYQTFPIHIKVACLFVWKQHSKVLQLSAQDNTFCSVFSPSDLQSMAATKQLLDMGRKIPFLSGHLPQKTAHMLLITFITGISDCWLNEQSCIQNSAILFISWEHQFPTFFSQELKEKHFSISWEVSINASERNTQPVRRWLCCKELTGAEVLEQDIQSNGLWARAGAKGTAEHSAQGVLLCHFRQCGTGCQSCASSPQ